MATSLPAESRTMRALSGLRFSVDQLLLAAVLDQLRVANWMRTKDAKHKRNFPRSILDEMVNPEKKPEEKDELQTFSTGAEFDRRLAELRGA